MASSSPQQIISHTQQWVKGIVIGLGLCPFAGEVYKQGQIRYVVSQASDAETLLEDLNEELDHLLQVPASTTDTTLLIHPLVLEDFLDYWDFLEIVDGLLAEKELEGIIQIASFHPRYQFAGTEPDSPENFSNRSPYPMLHLLREESVDQAVDTHPDPEGIPNRNIAYLNQLGSAHLTSLTDQILETDN